MSPFQLAAVAFTLLALRIELDRAANLLPGTQLELDIG
jgi:hypothetical protein